MKFDLKLNTDAPGQHTAILALAGVFIFLSLLDWVKSDGPDLAAERKRSGTYAETGETIYQNPKLTWYEQYFCRGYQRSSFCSFRLLHPFRNVFESHGVQVREEKPEVNGILNCAKDAERGCYSASWNGDGELNNPDSEKGVVRYRGPLPKNRAFSGKISLTDFK